MRHSPKLPLSGARFASTARLVLPTLCLTALSCGALFAQSVAPTSTDTNSQIAQNYGKLPLSFEANQGQTSPQVKFLSRGDGYSLFLTDKSAVLALSKAGSTARKSPESPNGPAKTDILRMELAGGAVGVQVSGANKLPGISNYFPASDPKSWHTNIPTYAKVKYAAVYPGIDLVYYGNQRQLEYDFVVAAHASPDAIQVHFAGAKRLKLNSDGDLAVIARNGAIAFHKPVVYQMQNGQRQSVDASFKLETNNRIGFSLGRYDHARELVIDPVLAYSTYLGGQGTDQVFAITVDSSGAAYMTGETTSTVGTKSPQLFPTTSGSYQPLPDSVCCYTQTQAFVTKLNATGTALVYSTFLGTGNNHGRAITVDAAGDAYITGYTNSPFPVTARVYEGTIGGTTNAFVTELGPTGASLVASTFLGANPFSAGYGIAVDPNGDVFVAGQANSACCNTFPTTTGAYQTVNSAASSVFVSRLSANFSTLAYSTLIGGTNGPGDAARGLVIDSSDNAYIVGYAGSSNYPTSTTTTPFQKINNTTVDKTNPAPGYNAIVSVINPKGSELLYSTYLGGSGSYDAAHKLSYYDYGNAIALDGSGNIYIAGTTGSSNFPFTTGAYQTANPEVAEGGFQSGFVTKFNPTLTAEIYSTYLGGTDGSQDTINGLALDGSGDAYVTGTTTSEAFPTTPGAFQSTNPGADNLATAPFLTRLNSTGSALLYSTYFGGANGDSANAIAVDASGNAYLAGYSYSTNFPTSTGSTPFQATNNSLSYTGWVAKLAPPNTPLIASSTAISASPQTQILNSPVTFTATVSGSPGAPAGTVSFAVDGTVADTLTLSGGKASYTTGSLAAGTHSVTATYNGSTTFAGSGASLTETIVLPPTATPTFSPGGSTYSSVQTVAIGDATAGATIYYTLDGSTPTTGSAVYSAPLVISSFTDLNAIAVLSGHTVSNIASATYKIVGSPSGLASPATAISTPNATLNAVVNTNGVSGGYYFRYGTSPSGLFTKTASVGLGASTAPVNVSVTLTTLQPKTTYYFEVFVASSGGAAVSTVLSFTTN